MLRIALLIGLLALATAGCGGEIRTDELKRGVESLGSSAAEGQLLAHEAAEDRAKSTFTRVHARDLADTVTHEAEKLSDASAGSETRPSKESAVELANTIAGALGDLQVAPGDAAVARTTERRLADAAQRAARLGGSL
jgi:hypothetical protein